MATASETATDGPGVLTTQDVGSFTIANTQLLSTRYAMAYAAGINDDNPAYFDDLQPGGVKIHPAIAFSLQWASRFRPDQPINLRAAPFGVHASTDLRIYRPFRAGEAVTTQGQLMQKRQLRPGVFNLDRYRIRGSDGELIAELDYNGITRGATLNGPDSILAPAESWPMLAAAATGNLWQKEISIARHAGQQYTECAQIYNPIHTEPSVAKAAGLPDIILHGSATMAIALTAVVDQYFSAQPERITRLCGELRAMVLMDTTMVVEVLAEEMQNGERRVFFRALNEQGQPAIANGVICGTH